MTPDEQAVLEIFAANAAQELPAHYVASCLPDLGIQEVVAVCKALRKDKLIAGQGSGEAALLHATDKGLRALGAS